MAVKLGDLYSNLDLEYSGFLTGLKKSAEATESASKRIASGFDFIKRAAERVFAYELIRSVKDVVTSSLEFAGSLDEVSQQLGVTARDLQVYRYAAGQVGISQDEMDKALQKFTKSLGAARAGSQQAVGVFKELGFTDADIKRLDVHDALLKTADGIAQVKDRANRATPEVALFGKAGQQLDTFLAGGSAGINQLAKAAEDLGIVLSHDQIENADRTADKLTELKTVLEANIASVVANNAAAIYDFATSIEHLIAKLPQAILALRSFAAYVEIGAGEAQRDLNIANIIPGYGARMRAQGRSRIDEGEQKLRQIDIDRGRQNPPSWAKGSLNSLENYGGGSAGGGKRFIDPAEAARQAAESKRAAAEAKRKAEEAARNENRYQESVARSQSEILGLNSDLTADYVERNKNAREQVDIDHDAAIRSIDLDTKLTAGQKEVLKGLEDKKADLEHDRINREENIQVEKDELDLAQARLANARDLLSEMQGTARTAAERREIELKLLANARQQEENSLAPILADADRPIGQRRYTQEQIDQAKDRYSSLNGIYGAKAASVRKSTQGPGESYLDGLIQSAGEAKEALQSVEVDGLKGIEDGLAGAIAGTEKLGDVFKNVGEQIVAELAKIEIERAIVQPLANALFGGSGLSSEISATHAAFSAQTPSLDVGSLNTAVGDLHFAGGGGFEVGGSGGADSKLFNLALSPGEAVNVTKGADAGRRGATTVHQTIQFQGGVDLATRGEVYRMGSAVHQATLQAIDERNRRRA